MNISRNFLLIGILYLLAGVIVGMFMGMSQDFSLAPAHAHINLVGFVLMVLFAVIYKMFADMAQTAMARVHFWLHQIGSIGLVTAVFLVTGGFVEPEAIGPLFPISEIAITLGVAVFGWNAFKNAR